MKIFCVGRNYVAHAKELNNPVPDAPVIFMKPPTAQLKDGKPFYIPEFSNEVHFEGEVVLRICKNGKYVQPAYASKYFRELTIGIDFTARDVQSKLKQKGHPWEIAKAFDHSACYGEFIDKSQLSDANDISFSMNRNDKIVQKGNTSDMIFSFEDIICYISRYFTIQTGDLIFTGTPAGVGKIAIGDQFEGFIDDQLLLKCEVM